MRSMGMAAVLCLLPAGVLAQGVAPTTLSVATEQDFQACDGNGAPGLKYDGRQKGAWLWSNRFNRETDAAAAIVACDKALAEPMLADRYWSRRVALLQAKAIHQLGAKAYADALSTLDKADAAVQRPAVIGYQDPVRIADQMLRAVALYGMEKKDDARAALRAVTDDRPWSFTLREIARGIQLANEPDFATHRAMLREGAALDSRRVSALFWLALAHGDFAEAASYGSQVNFDIPRGRGGGWSLVGEEERRYELIRNRASVAGATAYALAATGDSEGAKRAYQRAIADLDDAAAPPPSPDGRPLGKREQREYSARKASAEQGRAQLADWDRAIRLRAEAPRLSTAQLTAHPDRPRYEALLIAPDLVAQAKGDPTEAATVAMLSETLRNRFEQERRRLIALPLSTIASMLPRVDDGTRVPVMKGEGFFFAGDNLKGFAVRKADDPDLINIRFSDVNASDATVEEGAFLAAANYVESQGKDGFIVEAGDLVKRSITTRGMYIGSYTTPSGWELRLLIRPVTVAALPPSEEASRWRVIKAADVKAALAKKFAPPPSAK